MEARPVGRSRELRPFESRKNVEGLRYVVHDFSNDNRPMLAPLEALSPSSSRAVHLSADTGPMVEAMRDQIDARLAQLLGDGGRPSSRVGEAMRYGALAPGKRVRPLLTLLVGRALGIDSGRLIDAACALEMVHAASLFVDDLPCMDDADLRRGQATVHMKFGEDVAVLAAIALLTCAYRTIATAASLTPSMRMQMTEVLSNAVGLDGLVGGQYRDLHTGPNLQGTAYTEQTNEQKTGVLLAASFEIACFAASASPATRHRMRAVATELGQAFQLADDLTDAESTDLLAGKNCGKDAGKATLMALLGSMGARERLLQHLADAQSLWQRAVPGELLVSTYFQSLFRQIGTANSGRPV